VELKSSRANLLDASHRTEFTAPAYNASLGDNPEFDVSHVRFQYESLVTPRSVFEAHVRNVELGIVAEGGVIGGLCEFDPVRGFQKICATRLQLHDSEIGQPSFAFE